MKYPNNFSSIITYAPRLIENFNFNNQTKEFLINTGLPKECAPFLSFVENNDIQYKGILPLTLYFDFLEAEYSRYIVIGSNGCGDEIVVDTQNDCMVKLLNHEDYFAEAYMNKSVFHLFNSLIIYQNFVDDVLSEFGDSGLIDFKYSDIQIGMLKEQLVKNDPESMNDKCFWNEEIIILIANKADL